MRPLRILMVTRDAPWPADRGARLRNLHLLKALSQRHSVDLATVGDAAEPLNAACDRVITVSAAPGMEAPISMGWRQASDLLESLRTGEPLWLLSKAEHALATTCRELVAEGDYDLVIASELVSASILIDHQDHPWTGPPVIYDAHNCEWRLLQQRAENEWPWLKAGARREIDGLRAAEARVLQRAALTLATSDIDLADLDATAGPSHARIEILPSAIDVSGHRTVREAAPEAGRVLVPGNFAWRPNLLGLEWFLDAVMPALRRLRAVRPLSVEVAGRMPRSLPRRLRREADLLVTPNPPDMRRAFAEAAAVAIPVLVSSGTRLRMTETMACARAVVSTTAGASGIAGAPGTHWLAENEPEAFAAALALVLDDEGERQRVGAAGYALAQAFDWREMAAPLDAFCSSVLEPQRTAAE
ncbi:MAG: glycosyltransferase [Pseudomonadota bacterium]